MTLPGYSLNSLRFRLQCCSGFWHQGNYLSKAKLKPLFSYTFALIFFIFGQINSHLSPLIFPFHFLTILIRDGTGTFFVVFFHIRFHAWHWETDPSHMKLKFICGGYKLLSRLLPECIYAHLFGSLIKHRRPTGCIISRDYLWTCKMTFLMLTGLSLLPKMNYSTTLHTDMTEHDVIF